MKTKKVYILVPNDFEKPCLYFERREDALDFAKTYKSGAYVSPKAEDVPLRTLERRDLISARRGNGVL